MWNSCLYNGVHSAPRPGLFQSPQSLFILFRLPVRASLLIGHILCAGVSGDPYLDPPFRSRKFAFE